MTDIVLVRHGEAECNVARRFGGPMGCTGLSDLGRQQSRLLRDRLVKTEELAGASALYASTLPRAIETGEILAGVFPEVAMRTDERLCELHPGEADNMSFTEYDSLYFAEGSGRWSEDPTIPTAPGGESWAGFLDRVSGVLCDLAEAHDDETIVVVCHGGVIEASLLQFLVMGGPYRFARFITENASMTEWSRSEDRWRLVRYNDSAHLAGLFQSS